VRDKMESIAVVSISMLGACIICGLWNIWADLCCPRGCSPPECCHSLFTWSFRSKEKEELSDETPLNTEEETKEYNLENVF